MIWKPADVFHPPQGRIDGIIYFGLLPMAQPLAPMAWDETLLTPMFWDQATSTWLLLPIADSELSANIPIMTAGVLPAVDGSLLVNLPAQVPIVGQLGTSTGGIALLDAAGTFTPTPPAPIAPAVAYLLVFASAVAIAPAGFLSVGVGGTQVNSNAGGADVNYAIAWLVTYV